MTTRATSGFLAAVFLLAGSAGATVISDRIAFEHPQLQSSALGTLVNVRDCRLIGNPGEPMLPVYSAKFILPPDEQVSKVSVEAEDEIAIFTGILAPMPAQSPIGEIPAALPRNEAIFSSRKAFPASRGELVAQEIVCGIRVAFVNVYPCRFIPSDSLVLFAPSVKVTIETSPVNGFQGETRTARLNRAIAMLEGPILNREMESRYRDNLADCEIPSNVNFEYIIITSPDFVEHFEPLVAIKERCGLSAKVVDTSWISDNFPGKDIQAKIRAFIAFAYDNWSTEYVLLGGDEEIIPHRSLYAKVGTTIDVNIASDLYYACLDGTWNNDGDSYYGEPGEEDLLPEITVGRLPVDSPEEIWNCIEKIERYSFSPVIDQCETALMLGELLWNEDGVITWGGDYKDEILFGSSNWGFTTAGIPQGFLRSTLYDRDIGTWGANNLIPILSTGVHLINHAGHASLYEVMRLEPQHVAGLTNDGISASYFICWSHGCYAASFDNRDATGTIQTNDCIAEELLTGRHGAIAFIGHSRLGWDAPRSTCGVSQFFDRRFFDAIFGKGQTTIGKALDSSRLDNIPYISYAAVRWAYYTICLLGDPSLGIWTSTPKQLYVTRPPIIYQDQTSFEVGVSDNTGPVEGARVKLFSMETQRACLSSTNSSGQAILCGCPLTEGPLFLSVVAPNHYPLLDTIYVAKVADFLAGVSLVGINDSTLAACCGDGDGIAEPGEVISPMVIISNLGRNRLNNLSAVVESENEAIDVIHGSAIVGSLDPGESTSLDTAFTLMVLASSEGYNLVPLRFDIQTNEGHWTIHEYLEINAPRISLDSCLISDEARGNGNGCLEAWEFQNLRCWYSNTGTSEVRSAVVSLRTIDPEAARVIKGTLNAGVLLPGQTFDSGEGLVWFVREATPPFARIRLVLSFSAENIPTREDTISVRTCGYELNDTAENEALTEHRAIVGVDEWHISSESFHSYPSSWKCGNSLGESYANLSESVLLLPPVCLFSGSTMKFWHRMNAEAQSSYPYWALDAGVLEVSTDAGKSWKIVSPVNQYPSRASPYNTIFLAPYQRCWSGTFDWREETVDLSAYSGPLLVRFHFASDEQRGFEGWYIDDIRITTNVPSGTPGKTLPGTTGLYAAYPNPFNPTTTIPFTLANDSFVRILIFDAAGHKIKTIYDGYKETGNHVAIWNGTDEKGLPVASGIYFCRFTAGFFEASTRLVLIR